MRPDHILAIDQGTTSTRAILFDAAARPVAVAQRELKQHYPEPGWVEHDPEDIWRDAPAISSEVLGQGGRSERVAAIGSRTSARRLSSGTARPANRSTAPSSGRTADGRTLREAKADGVEPLVAGADGSPARPLFLRDEDRLDTRRCARELALGPSGASSPSARSTASCSGGSRAVRARDRCHQCQPHPALRYPRPALGPGVVPAFPSARSAPSRSPRQQPCLRRLRARAIRRPAADRRNGRRPACGPVRASLLRPGMVKSTYGTGCFMLVNTGERRGRIGASPADDARLPVDGHTTYALEGSIFVAGAAIKWLRDGLGVIAHASDTDSMATRVPDSHGVYMVPRSSALALPIGTRMCEARSSA